MQQIGAAIHAYINELMIHMPVSVARHGKRRKTFKELALAKTPLFGIIRETTVCIYCKRARDALKSVSQ